MTNIESLLEESTAKATVVVDAAPLTAQCPWSGITVLVDNRILGGAMWIAREQLG